METVPTNSPTPQSFPAVKHLVWACVAGTVLVITGLRDDRPPPPPAAAAAPAPPAAPAPSQASVPVRPAPAGPALPYTAAERPEPRRPALVRRPTAPPVLVPRPPVRPAPLLPVAGSAAPSGTESARSGDAASAAPRRVPGRSTLAAPPTVPPLPPVTPVRLRIPSLKVDAPMMKLGLDASGALKPPPDNNPVLTGWYAGGTVPGSVGTAVTAGHVDTRLGPGVFQQLGLVRTGATVEIIRQDLSTAVFTVYAVETYDKKNFPDKKVYGPSARPELRVITCGGDYDKKSGYQDNVVVFASLTASR
ncbi:class F sortase [Streptomyces sp. NPDC001822]|uniref:class F sortase n=1 Tax=Streptomyces sp. NPDC001822 TaxID=3364614 RepID=UPI0036B7448D